MPNPAKTKAVITQVLEHGQGIYSVKMKTLGPAPRAKPGQFLHLTVDDFDPAGGYWPESRVFSIASAPDAAELEIVYSVKGKYTRRMEERLEVGREVWIKLPYGDFIIDAAVGTGQDAVLIAGGTGLSPYLPYLQTIRTADARSNSIKLYYGVRRNSMLLARELLGALVVAGLIDLHVDVEDEAPDARIPSPGRARQGRLDIDAIIRESEHLKRPVFFISGPPAMIISFKERLGASGVESGRIKIDEWE